MHLSSPSALIVSALAAGTASSQILEAADAAEKKAALPTVKEVSPDEAERIMKLQPGLVILDVRTSEEFSDGHLSGAQNINFFASDFVEKAKAFEGKSVLIHCASGGRSSQALQRLKDASFSTVFHLKAGFTGWQAAGKKTVRN